MLEAQQIWLRLTCSASEPVTLALALGLNSAVNLSPYTALAHHEPVTLS
jgi:hypothetical protein